MNPLRYLLPCLCCILLAVSACSQIPVPATAHSNPPNVCQTIADYYNTHGDPVPGLERPYQHILIHGRYHSYEVREVGSAKMPILIDTDELSGEETEIYDADGGGFRGQLIGVRIRGGVYISAIGDDLQAIWVSAGGAPRESRSLKDGPRCLFDVTTEESVGSHSREPALCHTLLQGREMTEPDYTVPVAAAVAAKEVYYTLLCCNATTRWLAQWLDVYHTGRPLLILPVNYRTLLGWGEWGGTFFLALTEDQHIDLSPEARLLYRLQTGWEAPPEHPRFYMLRIDSARLFSSNGVIYYESRYNNSDTREPDHSVRRIEDGKVIDVCDFQFTHTIKVNTILTPPPPDDPQQTP